MAFPESVMASSATSTSSQSRFFIALLPPPAVRDHATRVKAYFRDRYHSKAALRSPPHITLQPPFKWPDAERDRLYSALSDFAPQRSPVPVTLSGFGAFPPRVIFLAVEHTPDLMALQQDLSRHLAKTLEVVDPKAHSRPFRPHLTVAFRDLKPAAFRRAWPEFEHRDARFDFTVRELTLLVHTEQAWEVHQTFSLQ